MERRELIKTGKRLAWVALLLGVAVVVISAIERKNESPATRMEIIVEPLRDSIRLLNEADVLEALNRSFGYPMEGLALKEVNVARIERVLEEEPLVLDADAYLDAANVIHVRIKQREPVLRIMGINGLNYYLDKNGLKMPLSRHYTARVLVATGNIPPHVPDFLERRRHVLKDLFLLANEIMEDEFLNAMIGQIYVSSTGEFRLIPMLGDQQIEFGKYTEADEKLRNLKAFYKEVTPYEGWRKYRSINLKFKGQVVCSS